MTPYEKKLLEVRPLGFVGYAWTIMVFVMIAVLIAIIWTAIKG